MSIFRVSLKSVILIQFFYARYALLQYPKNKSLLKKGGQVDNALLYSIGI